MHHIEIYVSNLANTTIFYNKLLCQHLNYLVFQEWPEGISYKKDDFYIVFVQTNTKNQGVPYKRTRVGLNHLAFTIDSREQLDNLRTLYNQSKNITVLYDKDYPFAGGPNHYALYLEDPDRIKIEIVAR